MLGTIVNSLAIIIGSLIGVMLNKGIKDDYKDTIMDGIALTVMVIGITSGIKSNNIILLISSIVIGSILGEGIGIERKLDRLGDTLQRTVGGKDSNFSKGFVTASLVFCVGAMAIVGSLEAGIQGDYNTLFAKSILDGISSVVFASTLGIGVAFAAIPVFIYQGLMTITSGLIKDLFTPEVINEMSAVGGILIMAIGINVSNIKKVKVGNMLPAIFIPILYYLGVNLISFIR